MKNEQKSKPCMTIESSTITGIPGKKGEKNM